MYRQKLCLGLNPQFELSYDEQIHLLAQTGFDGFFVDWRPEFDMAHFCQEADAAGMILQSVHAPFGKSKAMWEEDEAAAQIAKEELLSSLRGSAEAGAPIMVVHPFITFQDHTPTQAGIDRFGQVVDAAKKAGVKIAFENVEGEEYLAALMDAFRGESHVGFCWDTGHELCYNRGKDMMALYGDRILCTHLDDNLGVKDFGGQITFLDDLHLLPFDGIADWQGIVDRLNRAGFNGELTFEMCRRSKPNRHENDRYTQLPVEVYFAEIYNRACRVAAMKLRRQAAEETAE